MNTIPIFLCGLASAGLLAYLLERMDRRRKAHAEQLDRIETALKQCARLMLALDIKQDNLHRALDGISGADADSSESGVKS